ncbi:MAG: hypothetical protein K1X47_06180 [Cyclobacteriaceae bacterium]|nr:hypothetical protein [Cyclobacteriaceae bacterium]
MTRKAFLLFFLVASHQLVAQSQPAPDDWLRVNRILIVGNNVTRDRIIQRELSLHEGDSIRRDKLDTVLLLDRNKIYNLRLFNTASVRALELSSRSIDLLVDVSERWYIFPIPIFELSDRNLNEWYQNYNHDFTRVNYGMRLYHNNFRGRNEKVILSAQFGFSRRFELSYRIPNLDARQKRGLQVDFEFAEPKNAVYATKDHILQYLRLNTTVRRSVLAGISMTFRKNFYQTHGVRAEFRSTRIADTIAYHLNPNYFGNDHTTQWYTGLSYSFVSEHRDVIAYPLHGYQFTGLLYKMGLDLGDQANQSIAMATYAHHLEIGPRWYLSNFSVGYLSRPDNPTYAQFGGIGYRRQIIRGYEVYVVEGPQYFLNKTTLKKRIFNRTYTLEDMPWEQFRHLPLAIYLKTFVDFGYVQNYPYYQGLDLNTRLSNYLLGGFGVGLDMVTAYDGVFRFEYTMTREGRHGFFFNLKKEF